MVAVAILSGSLTMIFRAFILSVDYINHLVYRLYANTLLDNQVETLKWHFQVHNELPVNFSDDIKKAVFHNKEMNFGLRATFSNVENLDRTIRADLTLSWQERNRTISISRSAYISRL